MSVLSRALTYSGPSMKCHSCFSVCVPPDVRIETSAECMRSILETTRQYSRSLVKLCFLFVGIHVIKSDGLSNTLNRKFDSFLVAENSRHPMKKPTDARS